MNKTITRYFERNIFFPKLIDKPVKPDTEIIIVIPCHNEDNISDCIKSIIKCKPPSCSVEIIVSINAGVEDSPEVKSKNIKSLADIELITNELPEWLRVHGIMNNDLPKKKAGVGLGRKIGMDEAVRRFLNIDSADGIIVCYDADSTCAPNYLLEIRSHFYNNHIDSTSINFEHPIEGDEFPSRIYQAIMQYELHLRYFIHMQKRINLPFAYHTIGSSMACTVSSYCAVGGMNQRKAGEDFYFIHKLVKYGKHSELNSTKVIPSPRISDRVPFGTGKAVGIMNTLDQPVYFTYAPQSFWDLQVLVNQLPVIYTQNGKLTMLPGSILDFLATVNVHDELKRIYKHTSDFPSFEKMFWHWFDAFLLMKYVHFARDNYYPDIPVLDAVNEIENEYYIDVKDALLYYRYRDTDDVSKL